jgi:hypothetical protein
MDFEVLDQSIPEDELETPSLDTSLAALFATFSSRGPKNKIIECRTSSAIKTTFGDDFGSFEKYGQTNITALRVAKSGGRAFICSLMPNDAKVSYSLLGVTVKPTDGIPVYKRADTEISADGTTIINYGKGSFVLDSNGNKQQVMLKPSASSEEESVFATTSGVTLKVETKQLQSENVFDGKGYPTGFDGMPIVSSTSEGDETFYPLILANYYSKGKGGNYFAFRINRDTSRDKKITDGRRYKISFLELLSTGSYKSLFDGEEWQFSFNKNAVYSDADDSSEYLGDVWTNIDGKGEDKMMQLQVYGDSFNSLVNAISMHGGSEETTPVLIDVLNGVFQNGNPYNKIVISDDSIDIENTIVTLDYGNDGSLDESNHTADEIAQTKEELLTAFFNCDVDDSIFDEKMVDCDILPDCNYPDPIKKTIMSSFSMYRPDVFLAMDLGTNIYSNDDAVAKYRELNSYVNTDYSYMCAFFGHAGYLNDKEVDGSARIITTTYDYVGGLADNFSTGNGAFQMQAGANRGRVKYIIPFHVSMKNKANDIETLEDYGINNIQYLNKNKDMVYMLESSQYTVETSKLMSNRNALVIGRLIRMCAGILPYYKYDENNISTTLVRAKAALEAQLRASKIPSTINVSFNLYQTKADVKAENAHCYIGVAFPDYIKKFHVVIAAKRQQSTSE